MGITERALELFRKADQRQLSEKEKAEWLETLEGLDFQAFCIERAQPHYMEGQIVSKRPDQVRVEWHDGERENIPSPICSPLIELNEGDEFGAWVKLGRDERTLTIVTLEPLPHQIVGALLERDADIQQTEESTSQKKRL